MYQATHTPSLPTATHIISRVGTWGLAVAGVAALSTAISALTDIWPALHLADAGAFGLLSFVGAAVSLVIGAVMAIFLIQASLAFRGATDADRTDAQQLVRGIRKLRCFFKTMGISFLVAIGFGVLGFMAMSAM